MSKNKRILLLAHNFYPDKGAVANRLLNLCKGWQKRGAEVEVLCPMPYYPEMEIYKPYKGKLFTHEKIEGITVYRCFLYLSKGSILGRIVSYLSFALLSLFRGLFLSKKYDILFMDLPPLFHGYTGLITKLFKAKKLVANFSDLWVESADELGLVKNRTLLSLAKKVENSIAKRSDLICGQTQHIVRTFQTTFPAKQHFWLKNGIYNFEQYELKESNWREANGFQKDDYIIAYTGLMGHAQDMEIILNAAEKWRDSKKVHFVLVGDGPMKDGLLIQIEKRGLYNVHVRAAVPKNEVLEMINACDAGIITLKKNKLFKGAIPSKIFDYLALAKPILLGVEGEAKQLFIDETPAGLFFEPENAEALVAAIIDLKENEKLAHELGRNGRALVQENFNYAKTVDDLFDVMQSILKDK